MGQMPFMMGQMLFVQSLAFPAENIGDQVTGEICEAFPGGIDIAKLNELRQLLVFKLLWGKDRSSAGEQVLCVWIILASTFHLQIPKPSCVQRIHISACMC